MKLLLTSAGITNASIRTALIDLLGKPIAESHALVISTASYPLPRGPKLAWTFISGNEPDTPMAELGWASVGNLELTALPSLDRSRWTSWVRETDAILVNGGDPLYLCHWMRESGFADVIRELERTVYVGLSAGSMVMTPSLGEGLGGWWTPSSRVEMLGLVPFSIFPHLDHPDLPENRMADAERWAAGMAVPSYAIDDQTAILPGEEGPRVISEGHWRRF